MSARVSDWESDVRRLLTDDALGMNVSIQEAVALLDDVMLNLDNIKSCASACVQWPGDDEKAQAIRAAGVLLCEEFGIEIRESEMEPESA